jgi:hypothetical protein
MAGQSFGVPRTAWHGFKKISSPGTKKKNTVAKTNYFYAPSFREKRCCRRAQSASPLEVKIGGVRSWQIMYFLKLCDFLPWHLSESKKK